MFSELKWYHICTVSDPAESSLLCLTLSQGTQHLLERIRNYFHPSKPQARSPTEFKILSMLAVVRRIPQLTVTTEITQIDASVSGRLVVVVRSAALSSWGTRRRRARLEGLLLWRRIFALRLISRILLLLVGHHWYAFALDCFLLLHSLIEEEGEDADDDDYDDNDDDGGDDTFGGLLLLLGGLLCCSGDQR